MFLPTVVIAVGIPLSIACIIRNLLLIIIVITIITIIITVITIIIIIIIIIILVLGSLIPCQC